MYLENALKVGAAYFSNNLQSKYKIAGTGIGMSAFKERRNFLTGM
jgi:hypothetical protein